MSSTMPRETLRLRFGILLLLSLGFAFGCNGAGDEVPPPESAEASRTSLAIVDGSSIPARVVDLPLQLDLHDLEYARYERRLEQLQLLISKRLGPDVPPGSPEWEERVEIQLEPPQPPRLEIPDGGAPIRGAETAPVTLVAFVDFESPHSRRLQPELAKALERYPDHVRFLARDLPLPYHRYAWDAASAAHCAAEQGAYWAFHDALLLKQPDLAPTDLSRYAAQLGLDSNRFEACAESGRHAGRIMEDLALAARLGVRRAGTLFVNGLYLTGRPGFPDIDRVIRGELVRLGLDVGSPVEVSEVPTQASEDVSEAGSPARPAKARDAERPTLPEIPASFSEDPEIVITLSRAEVDRALRERERLDRKLEASAGEFSGQRLLKIREIDADDFYARLGLEERDVLIIVNGEFVTVEHPTLWDAFEIGDRVTIVVMRRGLPHTYEYQIR
jgi:protein-disulfide isomerase